MPTAKFSAERRDRLEVERPGADADAEAGVAQEQEQQRHRDHHHRHHEQPVAGDEEQFIAQGLRQEWRDGDRLALRTPDETGAVLDHEGQPKGQ